MSRMQLPVYFGWWWWAEWHVQHLVFMLEVSDQTHSSEFFNIQINKSEIKRTPERQQTSAEQASCGLSVTDIMVMILYGDLVKLQVICITSLGTKKAGEVRENKRNLPDSQLLSYSLQLFGLCMQFAVWGFHHWSRSPYFSRCCSENRKKLGWEWQRKEIWLYNKTVQA